MSLRLGYPGYASLGTEANVVAQWLFDEAAGNIVDEVAGLALAQTGAFGGGAVYNVASGSPWQNLSPGITMSDGLTYAAFFSVAGMGAGLNFGASDFVVEAWFRCDAGAAAPYLLILQHSVTLDRFSIYLNFNTLIINAELYDGETATLIDQPFVISDFRGDGKLHKVRVAGARAGNATVYLDETSLGTFDISALVGESLNWDTLVVGNDAVSGTGMVGGMYELRITVGNATNNSFRPTRIGTTADGNITRTETVISGNPPDPLS